MKKYTIEDFEKFERDEIGWLICPSGDYRDIKTFPKCCRFGELCRFGKWSSFGAWCSFGEWCHFGAGGNFENGRVKNGTYFACDRIGSERRKTYFFIDGDRNMFVRAGCFFGTMDEFAERVKKVHAGTRYEKEYLVAVDLAKIVLSEGGV